ncbi:50S ribosomal protein L11 methyltransferase [bacterium]|nr:MAG: 50S ribosomal protein L11 methyltransferase [bacterium]
MSWIEVRARFAPLPVDTSPIVEIFRDHGIENTGEAADEIAGCLTEVAGAEDLAQALRLALLEAGAVEASVGPYEEKDWENEWKKYFHPRRIGRRFVIQPSWETEPAEAGDLVIVLDPGQAFGTGDHPTTRLCLELLEETDIEGLDVADVGCGSGILSIGAVMLGAKSVVANDIDPVAVEVAKENAARNNIEVDWSVGEGIAGLYAETPAGVITEANTEWEQDETPLASRRNPSIVARGHIEPRFDVIVANIISAILIRLAPDVADSLKPGGRWIVSGIIDQNWADVQKAAEGAGFKLRAERHEDGWVAARFAK